MELRRRSEWIREAGIGGSGWPDLSDARLRATLPDWLGPHLAGITRRAHLKSLKMETVLHTIFSTRHIRDLERLAPEFIRAPTGSRIRIQYAPGQAPVLAVRLQEMFGQTDTPRVGGGAVPVLLHLLSPAGRPLAVTQDLRSFWQNTYGGVRKEMRGKYPRHEWPEDPLAATPTRRTRRRSR
jgi:ATP-dependent helicase HrpB